jgi:peptide/nickel transport system substrate-binding protein
MAVLSGDDPEFQALADRALAVWIENLPRIPLVQARLLTPFNTTYWTNWPTVDNNYIHPGHWWVTGELMLINIQPAP